uniref:Uncharacterized protein n=1 Tax=Manihot esculenta TaxID=3983 RepID=A0A2C9V2E4_MANES
MELSPPKSTPHHRRRNSQSLPPRRGQIKEKIFKGFIKYLASLGKRRRHDNGGGAGFTTSCSSTPAVISSGYNSDVPPEC